MCYVLILICEWSVNRWVLFPSLSTFSLQINDKMWFFLRLIFNIMNPDAM